jgi:transcriptional regulator with XRE-family HTH domain
VESIGVRLRAIRLQRQLSLREVEERSLRFAQKQGNQSYQVSASWLTRLEREEHQLAVNKLIALADIYSVPPEQLLRSMDSGGPQPMLLSQFSGPNATTDHDPDDTTLFSTETGSFPVRYSRGIIGKHDRILEPMIPAGSIVLIDTRRRAISLGKNWKYEFQRPIYFLMTRESYVCGWCELDRDSDWLTLVPHTRSPAFSQRWRYRKEIENIGRVVFVAIRLP